MRKHVIQLAPMFCLHIRKYRETSAILNCFTQEHGRLDCVAKGLYRAKSNKDLPEYFQEYNLSALLRTELGTLTDLELLVRQKKLPNQAWLVACYCNELLIKFLPKYEPLPELYLAYQTLLNELRAGNDYQLALLWFEKRLLDSLGYGINFGFDADNGEFIETDMYYKFKVASGFHLCSQNEKLALPGKVLQALAYEKWSTEYQEYFALAKRAVRTALKYQLGDNVLQSVSVTNELNQFLNVNG